MITLTITRATLIISPKRCFLTPTVFLVWGGDDTGTKKSISAKATREGGGRGREHCVKCDNAYLFSLPPRMITGSGRHVARRRRRPVSYPREIYVYLRCPSSNSPPCSLTHSLLFCRTGRGIFANAIDNARQVFTTSIWLVSKTRALS